MSFRFPPIAVRRRSHYFLARLYPSCEGTRGSSCDELLTYILFALTSYASPVLFLTRSILFHSGMAQYLWSVSELEAAAGKGHIVFFFGVIGNGDGEWLL